MVRTLNSLRCFGLVQVGVHVRHVQVVVERFQDSSSPRVRIAAKLENPGGRLVIGAPATLVAYPK